MSSASVKDVKQIAHFIHSWQFFSSIFRPSNDFVKENPYFSKNSKQEFARFYDIKNFIYPNNQQNEFFVQ